MKPQRKSAIFNLQEEWEIERNTILEALQCPNLTLPHEVKLKDALEDVNRKINIAKGVQSPTIYFSPIPVYCSSCPI